VAPELTWRDAHDGSPAQLGFTADGLLVAQVAFYDTVGGGGPGWVGYAAGERVTGRCTDSATARRLVGERWREPDR